MEVEFIAVHRIIQVGRGLRRSLVPSVGGFGLDYASPCELKEIICYKFRNQLK